jgi:hypothetical protein
MLLKYVFVLLKADSVFSSDAFVLANLFHILPILLGFSVDNMLITKWAIFFYFHLISLLLFVLRRLIIALLAFGAS